MLTLHEHLASERITNLAQLFVVAKRDYPHEWHYRFQRFGKNAGFTNSFFEKYVFFPSGVTHPRLEGDFYFMNARPYPGPDGEMQRTIVFKAADGYRRVVLGEDYVQRILKEAGVTEPEPVAMPPPQLSAFRPPSRPSIFVRLRNHFLGFAHGIGLRDPLTLVLWYAFLTVPFFLLLLAGLWLFRRQRA
jgi:hypothetical protein